MIFIRVCWAQAEEHISRVKWS